jgi:pseudaminic acid synthase
MKIKSFIISKNNPFIVAEISGNHNGNISLLKKTILAAKNSGVDAVKLQTYSAKDLTINTKNKKFLVKNVKNKWKNKYLFNIYKRAQTPIDWHKVIFNYCKKIDVLCFSSPFSVEAVEELENIGCPAYKVASLEITNKRLLKKIATTGKPTIISTGGSNIKEISEALSFFKGNKNLALLKCTIDYPCKNTNANVNGVKTLRKKFKNVEVGFSDHTNDFVAAITAVALGASIIEKHFILDNKINSVDNFFSINPSKMKDFVYFCKETPKVLGSFFLKPTKNEKMSLKYRRSIFVSSKINKGEKFTQNNIKIVRPATGTPIKNYDKIIGKVANKNYNPGDKI